VAGAGVSTIEGVRVGTPDGWWLLRASHTEAALVARAEAATQSALARLLADLDSHLAESGVSRENRANFD
jgi:phosphomannomutase